MFGARINVDRRSRQGERPGRNERPGRGLLWLSVPKIAPLSIRAHQVRTMGKALTRSVVLP